MDQCFARSWLRVENHAKKRQPWRWGGPRLRNSALLLTANLPARFHSELKNEKTRPNVLTCGTFLALINAGQMA